MEEKDRMEGTVILELMANLGYLVHQEVWYVEF